ncbi:MAG: transporter substrate-binding domain-containing protein [Candidatus Cloacimonetes bacterium]|nr:transporter substrate-binding domain-containing protein [Candidatus Cloacimonadota bacterium]MDD2683261.1 transporter substrate-binding domain-containing protein [Candidatus Cloacimonadota bacterium]MDD3096651.1 transporter substrate-binding domain-containing protein [Candidatus Cloacimonadota bacterium]MDD3578366.1 transporter substrate-binding domain-containing protein [Candidatus Cloacimonadota bacterium]
MNKTMYLLLILVLVLGACSKANENMVILTENYPPLSYIEDGEVTGFGSDVVNAMQAELGTAYPIQMKSWDEAYTTALTEANVLLFTMDRTPERENDFHFIGPLGSNVASFYANSNKIIIPKNLEEARTVAAIGTTTNWFTEQFLLEKGFTNLISKADPLQTIQLLADEEVELAVFTDVTLPELCHEAEVDPQSFTAVLELLSSDYYIAISKKTPSATVQKWQKAFEQIQTNGKLEELRGKWFGQ